MDDTTEFINKVRASAPETKMKKLFVIIKGQIQMSTNGQYLAFTYNKSIYQPY